MEKEKKEPCEAYIKRESVKPEHKRGKWIKYGPRRAGEQHYQCTHCKEYVNFGMWGSYYTKDFKYCPHCGAEME